MRRNNLPLLLLDFVMLGSLLPRPICALQGGSGQMDRLLDTFRSSMSEPVSQISAGLRHFYSFSCTGRQDGKYPDLASNCQLYYRCLGGAVYSYSCPAGEALEPGGEDCTPQGTVLCPLETPSKAYCQNQTDGFYPDYKHGCKVYYRCTNGNETGRWPCENEGTWDIATGSCGSGPNMICSPPSCWGLPDGNHPTPTSSCSSYFTCRNGLRTDQVCPFNSIFDYGLKRCVTSSSSVCYEQACEGRANGLHAAPHAPCNAFFRCFNGAMVKLQECPAGQIFDGRSCVSSSNFSCWSEGRGTCDERTDGYYLADESDCRGFFLCRQEQFIRAFLCAPGYIFNGRKCINNQNSICPSQPRRSNCRNKNDGYYTVEKSSCKMFYLCRKGNKVSEHSCPGNNVFNGEQCVDPVLFSCPSRLGFLQHNFTNKGFRLRRVRETDCVSRPNGYYLDLDSHCTKFFYCLAGKREYTKSCPSGQVFSGIKCVDETKYQCPVVPKSDECYFREDGIYQNMNEGCSSYYQCISGMKVKLNCPEGQLHNGETCRPSKEVYCPKSSLCKFREDGIFVDTDHNCRNYFKCKSETLYFYKSCKGNLVFNGEKCVPYFFYTCPTQMTMDCMAKPDGVHIDLDSGCRRYYFCYEGEKIFQEECTFGLVFNGLKCVREENYICPGNTQKKLAVDDPCRDNKRGFVQDIISGCKRYFYCFNGEQLYNECPDFKVFNGQTCVEPFHYKCPTHPSSIREANTIECHGEDGYYPDMQTGCQSYYYCRGGKRIDYSCEEDKLFSGVGCVSKEHYTCPSMPTCRNKNNGFYQDISSGCQKYFYCYNSVKYDRSCPINQVYNGQTCFPKSTYNCPSITEDQDCIGKSSGFYADSSSRCQKYFLCQNGVKIQTLSCPYGQSFNGKACVQFYTSPCSYSLTSALGQNDIQLYPKKLTDDHLIANTVNLSESNQTIIDKKP
ncbi:unnamed protein product, partial [Meganyctiphanes norvegica]